MRIHPSIRPPWWIVVVACAVLAAAVLPARPPQDLELAADESEGPVHATHNPPLLALPGEEVHLRYDLVCAQVDPESTCERRGDLYIRSAGGDSYEKMPLLRAPGFGPSALAASVPPHVLQTGTFSYYAVLRTGDRTVTIPSGGPSGPHRAWVLDDPQVVSLDDAPLDDLRPPDEVLLAAPWGSGPNEVGLDAGPERSTIGPASFDVAPDGSVVLVDQVNRRIVVRNADGEARRVSADVRSSFPDIAAGPAGTFFVLESSDPDGNPFLKHIASTGATLAAVRIADPIPSKVRTGLGGPYVLQYPSSMWFPVLDGAGDPLEPVEQIRRERATLLLQDHRGAIVKARPGEVRLALTDGARILSSWVLITPATPVGAHFGAVQLADPFDDGILVAVSLYTETEEVYRVLRLRPAGVGVDLTLSSVDWAESASVSRFRLGPDGSLYQLRSSEPGAEIVRFDLGGETR